MSNKDIILKEFEELKGQFVITQSWKIERLIAIGEDEMDYYYITYNGRKLSWNTCVGKLIRLKGKLDDKDYNEFERIADLNHYDRLIDSGVHFDNKEYTIEDLIADLTKDFGIHDVLLTDMIFNDENK